MAGSPGHWVNQNTIPVTTSRVLMSGQLILITKYLI